MSMGRIMKNDLFRDQKQNMIFLTFLVQKQLLREYFVNDN